MISRSTVQLRGAVRACEKKSVKSIARLGLGLQDDSNRLQRREYRVSHRSESTLILGGIGLALTASVGHYGLQAYTQWKESNEQSNVEQGEGKEATGEEGEGADSTMRSEDANTSSSSSSSSSDGGDKKAENKTKEGDSYFDSVMSDAFEEFGMGNWKETKQSFFAKNFYDGGFQDKMDKREAALILGVRESSTGDRIKERHRKIMLINHPDRGGSPLLTAKINEAKELLMKGK